MKTYKGLIIPDELMKDRGFTCFEFDCYGKWKCEDCICCTVNIEVLNEWRDRQVKEGRIIMDNELIS